MRRALPPRYRLALALPAGCGLRQGETFGLALDDIDFLGRVVKVQRQVKWVGNHLVFALPKRRKTREVPLPDALALALSAYVAQFPVVEVTLPWERPGGRPTSVRLL